MASFPGREHPLLAVVAACSAFLYHGVCRSFYIRPILGLKEIERTHNINQRTDHGMYTAFTVPTLLGRSTLHQKGTYTSTP